MGHLNLTPRLRILFFVSSTTLVLFLTIGGLLLAMAHQRFDQEWIRLHTQITRDLTQQISRALSAQDDLEALAVMNASRNNHPRLREAVVFDQAGTIRLHTDPGMMGKKTAPVQGPRLTSPEKRHLKNQARPLLEITAPIPDDEQLYFRVFFDETAAQQSTSGLWARLLILALGGSALLTGLTGWRLRRYTWLDPRCPADTPRAADSSQPLAECLLREIPAPALAINRENQIIAANPKALDLLQCQREDLAGRHVLSAPLAPALIDFYRQAVAHPETPLAKSIALAPAAPAKKITLTCHPATPGWAVALLTWS